MSVITVDVFLKQLNREAKDFDKKIVRVLYNISADVQAQAIRNVDRLLNKNKGKRKRAGSRGSLRNSIKLKGSVRGSLNNLPRVEAGEGLSYAAIHEFGGTVRPVTKKWLTIPVSQEAFGRTAEEINTVLKGRKSKLFFKMLNPQTSILYERKEKNAGIVVHFVLKKEVRMPERSYLRTAGNTILENQDEYVRKIFDTPDQPWSVK